jgi:hypothetical protein
MDKELQLPSVAADVHDEMVSQQPQKRKGGLITMPFIIGSLSIYLSYMFQATLQLSHPQIQF